MSVLEQQRDYSCAPAAISATLRLAGHDMTERRMMGLLRCTKAGTDWANISSFLRNNDFSPERLVCTSPLTFYLAIAGLLTLNNQVLLHHPEHVTCVTGIGPTGIIVGDSSVVAEHRHWTPGVHELAGMCAQPSTDTDDIIFTATYWQLDRHPRRRWRKCD